MWEKGFFYRRYANGEFIPAKKAFGILFPNVTRSISLKTQRFRVRQKDILGAEELSHTYTYRVLLPTHKKFVVKIPRGQKSYDDIMSELSMISAYNKKMPAYPIVFPKTDVVLSPTTPNGFILVQEYIEGNPLRLHDLEKNIDLQKQFQILLENAFDLLQKQNREQMTYKCTFEQMFSSLKSVLMGKKRSLEELLKNLIVDGHGRIRVVSLYILQMDIEALSVGVNSRIKKVIENKEARKEDMELV